MASLLTFRTLFVSQRTSVFKQQELKELPSVKERVLHSMKIFNMAAWKEVKDDEGGLPQIPSATVSGLRTFLRRFHHSSGSTTMMRSEVDDTKYGC